MKKTFLICPVRGHEQGETEEIVKKLEDEGWQVHWPPRDTEQDDPTGLHICAINRNAIEIADVVHVIWNGESQGCLFDLGMAFMAHKKIIVLSLPPETKGKSFQNMIRQWEFIESDEYLKNTGKYCTSSNLWSDDVG